MCCRGWIFRLFCGDLCSGWATKIMGCVSMSWDKLTHMTHLSLLALFSIWWLKLSLRPEQPMSTLLVLGHAHTLLNMEQDPTISIWIFLISIGQRVSEIAVWIVRKWSSLRSRDREECVFSHQRKCVRVFVYMRAGCVDVCVPRAWRVMWMCAALTLCSALPPDCIRINCTASKWSSISPNSSPPLPPQYVCVCVCVRALECACVCFSECVCLTIFHSLCLVSPPPHNPLFDTSLCRLSVCIFVCVCVCVWEREREREREKYCVCVCVGRGKCTYVCLCLHVQLHHRSGAIFCWGPGFSRSAILAKKDRRKRGRWGLKGGGGGGGGGRRGRKRRRKRHMRCFGKIRCVTGGAAG